MGSGHMFVDWLTQMMASQAEAKHDAGILLELGPVKAAGPNWFFSSYT